MTILSEEDKELLNCLILSELTIIETGFSISQFSGKVFLQNAINDFKEIHLKSKYGDIIPSMCTEYRYFIIGLLKNIKNEYKEFAVREVILPTIGTVTTIELLKALNNSQEV